MKYTIDATGKRIGRVASEAASLLMGKNISSFVRNAFPSEVSVEIINTSKSEIDQKKIRQKTYAKYSGYPGGLRHEKMSDLITKKGIGEVYRRAVYGMLPPNKLRPKMIKKLKIKS